MHFGWVDIALIVIVVGFVLYGLKVGFVHSLGTTIGMLLAILIGGYSTAWLQMRWPYFTQPIPSIILFIVILIVVSYAVGKLIDLLDKGWNILTIIPFLKSINGLLGGVFGFFEGMITVAALIYFTTVYLPTSPVTAQVLASPVVSWLGWTVAIVKFLFPKLVVKV